ncbi:hypothetical protein [Burkholderia stagnalis]|uniref:hypothetical protein n=1 Tax=Burkholderia stagnalis TaxID=1503054 RepID=UPI0012D87EED|nr:hypothetical protein [Burkholderia stagnalis]
MARPGHDGGARRGEAHECAIRTGSAADSGRNRIGPRIDGDLAETAGECDQRLIDRQRVLVRRRREFGTRREIGDEGAGKPPEVRAVVGIAVDSGELRGHRIDVEPAHEQQMLTQRHAAERDADDAHQAAAIHADIGLCRLRGAGIVGHHGALGGAEARERGCIGVPRPRDHLDKFIVAENPPPRIPYQPGIHHPSRVRRVRSRAATEIACSQRPT